jgi:hypothetical protein
MGVTSACAGLTKDASETAVGGSASAFTFSKSIVFLLKLLGLWLLVAPGQDDPTVEGIGPMAAAAAGPNP